MGPLRSFGYVPNVSATGEGKEIVGEATLRILIGLKSLRELGVANCRVDRSYVEELRNAVHLRNLNLEYCRIVEADGVVTVAKHVRLVPQQFPKGADTPLSVAVKPSGKLKVLIEPMPVIPAAFEQEADEESGKDETTEPAKEESGSADALSSSHQGHALRS